MTPITFHQATVLYSGSAFVVAALLIFGIWQMAGPRYPDHWPLRLKRRSIVFFLGVMHRQFMAAQSVLASGTEARRGMSQLAGVRAYEVKRHPSGALMEGTNFATIPFGISQGHSGTLVQPTQGKKSQPPGLQIPARNFEVGNLRVLQQLLARLPLAFSRTHESAPRPTADTSLSHANAALRHLRPQPASTLARAEKGRPTSPQRSAAASVANLIGREAAEALTATSDGTVA